MSNKDTTQIFHSGKMVAEDNSTRVRIAIEVVAGIIPNQIIPEFTKQFFVSSEDWYAKTDEAKQRILQTYGYANEYMRNLWNPGIVNWVRCDWIYF